MATPTTMVRRGGLVLTRRQDQEVEIDGGACTVIVRQCTHGSVKLQFIGTAKVRRGELPPSTETAA